MTIGVFLMLLQAISTFFKDVADRAREADRMSSGVHHPLHVRVDDGAAA